MRRGASRWGLAGYFPMGNVDPSYTIGDGSVRSGRSSIPFARTSSVLLEAADQHDQTITSDEFQKLAHALLHVATGQNPPNNTDRLSSHTLGLDQYNDTVQLRASMEIPHIPWNGSCLAPFDTIQTSHSIVPLKAAYQSSLLLTLLSLLTQVEAMLLNVKVSRCHGEMYTIYMGLCTLSMGYVG